MLHAKRKTNSDFYWPFMRHSLGVFESYLFFCFETSFFFFFFIFFFFFQDVYNVLVAVVVRSPLSRGDRQHG
jgi:hypothetical protein